MAPGSVEYLLHGCDAAPGQEREGPDHERHGGAAYLEAGIEAGEPQGVWLGRGMAGLGLSMRDGDTAQASDVRSIFGQLRYPEREVEGSTEKTPVYLGSAPRKYRTAAQLVADAEKKEPDASPERRTEIERTAAKTARSTHAYYDVTLSPVKSVSVYYTALLAGGDGEGAEQVRTAHFDAIRIAVESVETDLAYVRTGRHEGKGPGGRSVGVYEQATGLSVAVFEHHTNRDGEPQLHAHAGVLARGATAEGGIYAIDGYGFKTITDRLRSAYTRAYQQLLTERMDVLWGERADGKAREITGIDPQLLAEASTRSTEHVRPRVAELVEGYKARHGREPSATARRALVQQAVKDTRSPKTGLAGPAAVAAWARGAVGRGDRLAAALDEVDRTVMAAATAGTHPNSPGQQPATAGQERGHEHPGPSGQAPDRPVSGRQAALDVLAEIAAGQAVDDADTMTGHAPGGRTGQVPATVAGRVEAAVTDGIADVQTRYATWTAANLNWAIDDQLGDHAGTLGVPAAERPAFLQTLTESVLAQPGRFGIVQVSAGDPVPVPDELRRLGAGGDGRSKYRAHDDERYATSTHIGAEQRLLAGIQTPGAAALGEAGVEAARERLTRRGLSPDQAQVVAGVLGSGRAADVLVGPAGTGKSHTVGALGREWTAEIGGRVIGLATAQIAAGNLAELGLEAFNTYQFRLRFSPEPATGQVADRLGPRDLVVVDEAGMSSTGELTAIADIAERAGAKILYVGDHRQLQPVGAGGMFAHLAEQSGVLELDTVHRFTHPWEAEASLRLRDGDTTAASTYVDYGRVRTGTAEEMADHAVRGHVADLLNDKQALLIVASNEHAAQLSQQVHKRLVELGRVEPQVLFRLPDDTEIGVGDQILAQRNNRRLRVDPGPDGVRREVTNKEVYDVVGRDRDGQLMARDEHGAIAHLSPDYVRAHVGLAYAVTGHAAEGLTVDVGRELAGRDATREQVYLGLTRGRENNLLYLVTDQAPDSHDPQRIEDTPTQRLADIIGRSAIDDAALTAQQVAAAEEASMGMLGSLINQVTSEYAHDRNATTLDELLAEKLGADRAEQVREEGAYGRLLAVVYAAEIDGHDPRALLGEAVAMKHFKTARSVSEVMHWRVGQRVSHRSPEHEPEPDTTGGVDWTAFTENMAPGPVRDHVAALTALAVARQTELGGQAAAEPPAWARDRRPEIPDAEHDPAGRAEWEAGTGVVAAYREYRGIPDDQLSLGPAPPEAQAFARALWMAAAEQLHDDPSTLAWRDREPVVLYQAREAWTRELYRADTYGPRYVADDLAATHRLAAEIRDDATLAQAEADTHPDSDPRHTERAEAAGRYTQLAEQYEADAATLEAAHVERQQWWEATAPLRDADQAAAVELARRDLPLHRDPEPTPDAEQLQLLTLSTHDPSPTTDEPGEEPGTEPVTTPSEHGAAVAEPAPEDGLTAPTGEPAPIGAAREHAAEDPGAEPQNPAQAAAEPAHRQDLEAVEPTAEQAAEHQPAQPVPASEAAIEDTHINAQPDPAALGEGTEHSATSGAPEAATPGRPEPTTHEPHAAPDAAEPAPADEPARGAVSSEVEHALGDLDASARELRDATHTSRVEQARQQPSHEHESDDSGYTDRAALDQRAIEAQRRGQQIEHGASLETTLEQQGPEHDQAVEYEHDGYEYDD